MAQRWYYARGDRKVGPVTSQELRALAASGTLLPTDLVWIGGHDQGRQARLIKGLFTPAETGASTPGAGGTGRTSRPDDGVDTTLDLDRLRVRLTRHADAVPHHGLADLGSAVEVRGARRIPVYRIAWTSLFEGRLIEERQAPHDGRTAFPPPKHRRENLDAWALDLPSPTDFADGSSELVVEGSETVRGCDPCRSSGHVTCDGCQGRKAVTCGPCGGGGVVRCGTCSGTGRTSQVRSEQRTRICGNAGVLTKAHGTGYNCRGGRDERGNVCRRCNGTGVEHYIHQEKYPVPCVTCSGHGQHACQVCGGGRVVTCPKCGGQGQITCPACQGHRRVVQYLSVVRSHEAKEEVAITPADKCPVEAVQGLGPAEFRETLARSSFGSPPDVTLDPKLHVLVGPIRALRNKVRAQDGADRRRVGDRLRITEAQVVRLDYAFNGKEYTAWFSGEDGSVHAPESPITDAAARHIEDALAAWKEGRRKDAIRSLRPAVAMARKCPECRAVLDGKSPRIPEELMSRASAFSLASWVGNLVEEFRRWSFQDSPEKKEKPSPTDDFPAHRRRLLERAWVILPVVVFCFPVGLFLVWLNRSWSRRAKTCWTVGGAAFLALVLLSPKEDREPGDGGTPTAQSAAGSPMNPGPDAEFTSTSEAIIAEFEADEAAADRKYRDKRIEITFGGYAGGPHPDADYFLGIGDRLRLSDGTEHLNITALFRGEEAKKARSIDMGQARHSMVGRYAGIERGAIRLVDCRLGGDTRLVTEAGSTGAAKETRFEYTRQADGVIRQMSKYYVKHTRAAGVDQVERVSHGPTSVYRRDGTIQWIIMFRDGEEVGRRQFDEQENAIREFGDMMDPSR